ncbi:MAG: carbohydrate ABC transporter permease [Mycoplasmatales bacterium]
MKIKQLESRWAIFFMFPAVIGLLVFSIIPIMASFYYSTLDWFGFRDMEFIGLDNFKTLLVDEKFYQAMFNTFRMAIFTVPIGILLSCVIAALLNKKIRGVGVYRVLFYLPVVTMPAAISLVFKNLFNQEFGWINGFLEMAGFQGVNWLSDPAIAWITVSIIVIWMGLGFKIVILLASMQNIPQSYYDAADIDGVGPIRRFFSITVPMVSPVLFFLLITGIIGAMQLFDVVFMLMGMTQKGLDSTRTIIHYFYEMSFVNGDKGFGSAIVVVLFFILTFVSFINFKLQKKWVNYER